MSTNMDELNETNFETDSSLIFGENSHSETQDNEIAQQKREQLKQTKISKQGWSIRDIHDKIERKILNLNPDYQRNNVWKDDKRTSFIESLFMGIIVPPIYVVEIQPENPLETVHYEVVDGKQRISTINDFLNHKFKLKSSALEYYSDLYGNMSFDKIYEKNSEEISAFLSQVLDVYVITANSPEFSKYDIFSRLNRGAEPLYIDELRRSIWHSILTDTIENIIEEYRKDENISYDKIFTKTMINRYKDHGIFYAALASYYNTDLNCNVINGYNSRPRDMINTFLEKYSNIRKERQEKELDKNKIKTIMDRALAIYHTFMKKMDFR